MRVKSAHIQKIAIRNLFDKIFVFFGHFNFFFFINFYRWVRLIFFFCSVLFLFFRRFDFVALAIWCTNGRTAWQPLTPLRYVYSPWAFELSGNKSRAISTAECDTLAQHTHTHQRVDTFRSLSEERRSENMRRWRCWQPSYGIADLKPNSMLDWPMLYVTMQMGIG